MRQVTLEQTHSLLEKLAEYVMNQVPTRREINERFEQVDKRFEHIDKQLDLIRAQQIVFSKTFDVHHKRLEFLEDAASFSVRGNKV